MYPPPSRVEAGFRLILIRVDLLQEQLSLESM
jgi:hypothetical protein